MGVAGKYPRRGAVEKDGGKVRPLPGAKDVTQIESIADRTGAGIALAYRSGEADPVELTDCLLERIARATSDNVFITVMTERARAEATRARARYKSGDPLSPLDGVPIGWKDIFD